MPTTLLAVDIGGKGVRARLVRDDYGGITLVGATQFFKDPELEGIRAVEEVLAFIGAQVKEGVQAVSIACAGEIFEHRKVVISPNAHYLDGINLGDLVEKRYGVECILGNDMEMAAPGMHYMAGQPSGTVIAITWSSGIGVRVLRGGKAVSDYSELGHMVLDTGPLAPICGCGQRGHAEALIGGVVLTNQVRQLSVWRGYACGHNGKDLMHPLTLLDQAYENSMDWARQMYAQIAHVMGVFIHNLLVFTPDANAILLKGTVAHKALRLPGIGEEIRSVIKKYAMVSRIANVPFILVPGQDSRPGEPDDDTFYGCALLAREYPSLKK